MKPIEYKKIKVLIQFFFHIRKREICAWCLAVFGITLLYTILFPAVKDMAQMELEAMSKELLELVGMSKFSDMGNYIIYFGTIYGMILIAITVFAISSAAKGLLDEERKKSIEFLYGTPISRNEIYVAKYMTSLFSTLFLIVSAAVAGICSGILSSEATFIFGDYFKIIMISSMTPLFFMTFSFMMAAVSSRIGTGMNTMIIMMVSYVLGYLSKLLHNSGTWLSWFSPFEQFSYEKALALVGDTLIWYGGCFLIIIAMFLIGLIQYRHRDFML